MAQKSGKEFIMAVNIKQRTETEKKNDLVENILANGGCSAEMVTINGVQIGLACCSGEEDKKRLEETIAAVAEVAKTPSEVVSLLTAAAKASEKKAEEAKKKAEAAKKKAEKEEDVTELLAALLAKLGK